MNKTNNEFKKCFFLFLVALEVRLFVAALLLSGYAPTVFYKNNEPSHIAEHLAHGQGFSSPYRDVPLAPTAQQAPIYPVLLGGIFTLFGAYTWKALIAAILINTLAGACTSVFLLKSANAFFGRRVGSLSAWLWALLPYEAIAGVSTLSPYALSALMVAVFFWIVSWIEDRYRDHLLVGMWSAVAALLNPALLTILVAFAGYRLWSNRSACCIWRLAGAFGVCLLCLIPWTVRNYRAFGVVVPVRNNFGMELWLGNRSGMGGTVDFTKDFPSHDPREYSRLGEMGYMRAKLRDAFVYIRAYPSPFVYRVAKRFFEFWTAPSREWVLISLMSIIGCLLSIRVGQQVGLFVLLTLILMPIVYYLTHFWPTYRHPVEPLMVVMASYAGSRLSSRIKFRRCSADKTS